MRLIFIFAILFTYKTYANGENIKNVYEKIETEMGAAAVAEVIERMQIDDKDDIEQPSFFLCRGVPKIDSSSFELDRTSLDENTDLHESSVIYSSHPQLLLRTFNCHLTLCCGFTAERSY